MWETGAGTCRLELITVFSWKLAQVNLQLWVYMDIPGNCNWKVEVNAAVHGTTSWVSLNLTLPTGDMVANPECHIY